MEHRCVGRSRRVEVLVAEQQVGGRRAIEAEAALAVVHPARRTPARCAPRSVRTTKRVSTPSARSCDSRNSPNMSAPSMPTKRASPPSRATRDGDVGRCAAGVLDEMARRSGAVAAARGNRSAPRRSRRSRCVPCVVRHGVRHRGRQAHRLARGASRASRTRRRRRSTAAAATNACWMPMRSASSALQQRHHRAADDRHHQQARGLARSAGPGPRCRG